MFSCSSLTSRRLARVAALAVCGVLAAACGGGNDAGSRAQEGAPASAAAAPVKVSLGTSTRSLAVLPILHALQAGYFEQEGLDVEFQPPNAKAVDVAAGTASGASDIAAVGANATIVAAGAGRGVVGIGVLAQSPVVALAITNKALDKLKGKGINVTADSPLPDRLKALRELRLGVPPQGSTGQVVLRYTMAQNGLDADKILRDTRTLADGAALAAAARQGQIDGYLWSPPEALLPEGQGFGRTWVNWASQVPATEGINFTDVVSSRSFLEKNPEAVEKFMRALTRASQDLATSPEKVAPAVKAEWFPKLDEKIFELSFQAVLPAFQQGIVPQADAFSRLLELTNTGSKKPSKASFGQIYDASFAQSASSR